MSEIDSQELIEDLRDQIHDLEQDLREETKERNRLENELAEVYADKTSVEDIDKDEKIKELETQRSGHLAHIEGLTASLDALNVKMDEFEVKYIKALSIGESLKTNGNMDYFLKTQAGKDLLKWAEDELKAEANKVMKGEI